MGYIDPKFVDGAAAVVESFISSIVSQLPQLQQQVSALKFFQNCTVVDVDFALEAELLKAVYRGSGTRTIELKVRPGDTVLALKQKIRDTEGIPVAQQRLIFSQQQLADGSRLYDLKIFDGATVHLVLRLARGN